MKEHLAFLAASVAIMHPEIYEMGQEILVQLGKWAAMQEDLKECTFFVVISL